MTTIAKQIIINRLPLPCDLAEVIKEFCFHPINVMIDNQKTIHNHVQLQLATTTMKYKLFCLDNYYTLDIDFKCPITPNQTIRICKRCGNYVTSLYMPTKVPLITGGNIYIHVEKIKCICTHNAMRKPCGNLPRMAMENPNLLYERKAHAGFDYSGWLI